MKNLWIKYSLSFLFLCLYAACGSDHPIPDPVPEEKVIETTEEGSSKLVMLGYEDNATEGGILNSGVFSICIKDKKLVGNSCTFAVSQGTKRLDAMLGYATMAGWTEKGAITEGTFYWVCHKTTEKYTYMKLRIAYIEGNKVGVEYIIALHETIVNVNVNQPVEGKEYVTNYSIPRLNPENYYVEHTVSVNNQTVFNLALEWNAAMKHASWVAFVFDETTRKDNVGRTDAWAADPQLPKEMQVDNDCHRNDGFDRGHICASEDRVYAKAANEQTFYYSNMSPQFNSFNGGFWAAFEKQVRTWGRRSFEKLYVTKGGSLNQLLVDYTGENKGVDGVIPKTDAEGRTLHGLACPKYYYMAVLGEKDGRFQALGFWIEHRDDYGYRYGDEVAADVLQKYAVSIDKLEQETGIDFFCNLPDAIEDEVEKECNTEAWTW